MKGRTGGSMNGRIVFRRPGKPELNKKLCAECAAATGQPCIKASWEKAGVGHRYETHQAEAERRGLEFPFNAEGRKKVARKKR